MSHEIIISILEDDHLSKTYDSWKKTKLIIINLQSYPT